MTPSAVSTSPLKATTSERRSLGQRDSHDTVSTFLMKIKNFSRTLQVNASTTRLLAYMHWSKLLGQSRGFQNIKHPHAYFCAFRWIEAKLTRCTFDKQAFNEPRWSRLLQNLATIISACMKRIGVVLYMRCVRVKREGVIFEDIILVHGLHWSAFTTCNHTCSYLNFWHIWTGLYDLALIYNQLLSLIWIPTENSCIGISGILQP